MHLFITMHNLYLFCRKRFEGGDRGIRQYQAYFSKQNWRALDASVMKQHRAMNCLMCPHIPEFQLKKSNQPFVQALENDKYAKTHQPQTPIACQRLESESIPQTLVSLKDIPRRLVRALYKKMKKENIPKRLLRRIIKDSMTEKNIPKRIKRKIIAKAQNLQQIASVKKDLQAVYLTNTSFKKHDRLRALQYGSYKRQKARTHVGPIGSYKFNQDIVRETFQQVSNGTMELGRKMTGKWAPLSFSANLKKRFGPQPKALNGGQVDLQLSDYLFSEW